MRLSKILSAGGIASRRKAEALIISGRVKVNGQTARLGQSANPGTDEICVDGKPVLVNDRLVYVMLNKPKGYLTTVSDDRGRKTVMELISDIGTRVYPVGRLDLDSEGLLIFTNDGDFANKVAHPSSGKCKTYDVDVQGDAITAANLLKRPLQIDGRKVVAAQVKLVTSEQNGGILRISIQEGRNRQIRKMCSACGVKVKSLKRVSIGELRLGTLDLGKWRYLTEDEVNSFG
ncbi:MAG: rRNA pseudouridine synthase [Oscillospiraceae bacterium]|nr:rRNA pseudouridine synthase [Oscillospiraceae bacterium]